MVRLFTLSMLPCNNNSSSRVEDSKLAKYGSRSCSDKFWDVGGNRPNTCGPGIVCAATDANVECSEGEVGVPLEDTFEIDLSLAEDDGTGSH